MATKSKATRRIIAVIIGLVVLLVILGVIGSTTGWFGGGDGGALVETATAERRTITQVVTASGKVQPEVEVKISPDVSGEIIELPVKEGDVVRKGNLLARIKPDFYQAQREQAEANVLQSKANVAQRRADMLNAELELKRQKELHEKNAISESEYQKAQTEYEVAKAAFEAAEFSVQSAQARLQETEEELQKTRIYAPMSGTVSKLDVELGERVVGTGQMAGTEMMRVARLDQMEMEVDVNENDVVNVAVGDTASIEVDAYPERAFRGVVTEIANSARITAEGTQEQVTNFPVKIRVLDPHNVEARRATEQTQEVELDREVPLSAAEYANFRPGMSGTVDVFTKTVHDVVAVPIQAVTVRDFNQVHSDEQDGEQADSTEAVPEALMEEDLRKVVFVVAEDTVRMAEVKTGISDDTHIEIQSGLAGGETVVIGPYSAVSRTLEPGMKVREQEEERGAQGAFASMN